MLDNQKEVVEVMSETGLEAKEAAEKINASLRKLDNGEIVVVKRKNKKVVSREERKLNNKIRKKLRK
nr:Hypothetical protein PLANC_88 [Enterococcus phage Planchet]